MGRNRSLSSGRTPPWCVHLWCERRSRNRTLEAKSGTLRSKTGRPRMIPNLAKHSLYRRLKAMYCRGRNIHRTRRNPHRHIRRQPDRNRTHRSARPNWTIHRKNGWTRQMSEITENTRNGVDIVSRKCYTDPTESYRKHHQYALLRKNQGTMRTINTWQVIFTALRWEVSSGRGPRRCQSKNLPVNSRRFAVYRTSDQALDFNPGQPPRTTSIKSKAREPESCAGDIGVFVLNEKRRDYFTKTYEAQSHNIRRCQIRRRNSSLPDRSTDQPEITTDGMVQSKTRYSLLVGDWSRIHSGMWRREGFHMGVAIPRRNQVQIELPTLTTDSEGAFKLTQTTKYLRRSRHIDQQSHYIRQ